MTDSHSPFISRCALVLFISGVVLPPLLAALTAGSPRAEAGILVLAIACLTLATVLGLITRTESPSRFVLRGVVVVACLFTALLTLATFRRTAARKEFEAITAKHAEEARTRLEAAQER